MQQTNTSYTSSKTILAIVGMPGSGKTETAVYLREKDIPVIRLGQFTEERLKKEGLPVTPENERIYREKMRQELGMAAYAIKAVPKIQELLKAHNFIVLDGLYSWEEYTLLKEKFSGLKVLMLYAQPPIRYKRLFHRFERPLTEKEAYARDIAEIEKLNKGGPIAIADHVIENDSDLAALHKKIDKLLAELKEETK